MKNDSLDFNIVSVYFIILVHNSVNETLWKNIWKSRLCNWNFRKNSIFLESFRINLWNSWVRIKAIRISFLLCVCVCVQKSVQEINSEQIQRKVEKCDETAKIIILYALSIFTDYKNGIFGWLFLFRMLYFSDINISMKYYRIAIAVHLEITYLIKNTFSSLKNTICL